MGRHPITSVSYHIRDCQKTAVRDADVQLDKFLSSRRVNRLQQDRYQCCCLSSQAFPARQFSTTSRVDGRVEEGFNLVSVPLGKAARIS